MQQQNTIIRRNPNREEFSLALVGCGPTWELLMGILGRGEFAVTFPWVRLAGWVTFGADVPPLPESFAHTPEYSDCETLFAANPDLNLACDLTPDGTGMQAMRRAAPFGTALITEETVREFCAVTAEGRMVIGGGARLRRERSLFAALIDQIEEEILILDSNGRIMEINAHAVDKRGGDKTDYIGRFCRDIDGLDLCCGADEVCPYEKAMASGNRISEIYTKVTPDGRMRYFRIYGFPIGDEASHTKRLVLMRSDTTAHVQIEQRLQQSQKMAAIGELSTYIAHEIRNPLFAIGGFANSLLRLPTLDEAAREKVRIILEESRRLDEILKSIINFARPTDHDVGEVDVNETAESTVDLMGIGGADRHIAIRLELAPDLPKAHGNAEMIKQCLINIIKNSQEALAEGGLIVVRSRFAGNTVYVEVEDDGPGIPPELHEQIFSPFFSTKDKGSGLGLAMTRKTIGEMGGKVLLASQPGKGTTVSLALKPALAVMPKHHESEN